MPVQSHRRPDQDQSEDQEQERELGQQRRPDGDEYRPECERTDDPDDQHPLQVGARHRERRQDDHEDEEVVDRQALLDQVPGEVLTSVPPARQTAKHQSKHNRHGNVADRPGRCLPIADRVRTQNRHRQIHAEQDENQRYRRCPASNRNHCPPAPPAPGAPAPFDRQVALWRDVKLQASVHGGADSLASTCRAATAPAFHQDHTAHSQPPTRLVTHPTKRIAAILSRGRSGGMSWPHCR